MHYEQIFYTLTTENAQTSLSIRKVNQPKFLKTPGFT